MKLYTDLDEFLAVFDTSGTGLKLNYKINLRENGNLIYMGNPDGYDSYCSYNKNSCPTKNCGIRENCTRLYTQHIRELKLKRILVNGNNRETNR